MDLRRALGAGSVAVVGAGLGIVAGSGVFVADQSTAGLALSVFGAVLGVLLFGAGVWLLSGDMATGHVLRVAGWNMLGVIALGAVLAAATLHPNASLPTFLIADVLGVSAVAHVLIGINDVRRIRAESLARERQRTAVLNRVLRHNLRNDTQAVLGLAERLAETTTDPDAADLAEQITARAGRLGRLSDTADDLTAVIEGASRRTETAALGDVAETAAERVRSESDATVEVDVPRALEVRSGPGFEAALVELLRNAAQHAGPGATVALSATATDDQVRITVADDGPGVPDHERAAVLGEQEPTPLDHGSGLGLWLVRWVTEAHDGDLTIDDADGGGALVGFSVPRAAA